MTERQAARLQARREKFLPGGKPRWVRVYDNGGESIDRYTVVFTGRYTAYTGGAHWYLGMSGAPFHPQGVGQHGESMKQIDWPTYGHLGKKIRFEDLPPDCQRCALQTYCDLWSLNPEEDDG